MPECASPVLGTCYSLPYRCAYSRSAFVETRRYIRKLRLGHPGLYGPYNPGSLGDPLWCVVAEMEGGGFYWLYHPALEVFSVTSYALLRVLVETGNHWYNVSWYYIE